MKETTQNSTTEQSDMATTQPFPMVWDNNKISIYQFLLPYQHAEKLPEIAQTLPDESSDDTKLKWAAQGRWMGLAIIMAHHLNTHVLKKF